MNRKMTNCSRVFLVVVSLLFSQFSLAAVYRLPAPGNDIVGEIYQVEASGRDDLSRIGMRNDVGFHEMVEANPQVNPWRTRRGTKVTVPKQFILPKPRKGIVVNLAELRLYYFPPNSNKVYTYPIGIGRIGWNTPTLTTKVRSKAANPTWHVPVSVRDYVLETKGILLPDKIMPGPKNPLGKHAMRLSANGYVIHGTNAPRSIGKRVSSGCIRMLPKDIKQLFSLVPVGTKVHLVNEPYKVGWHNKQLYMESHKPLSDDSGNLNMTRTIKRSVGSKAHAVNWSVATEVAKRQRGLPEKIGLTN